MLMALVNDPSMAILSLEVEPKQRNKFCPLLNSPVAGCAQNPMHPAEDEGVPALGQIFVAVNDMLVVTEIGHDTPYRPVLAAPAAKDVPVFVPLVSPDE